MGVPGGKGGPWPTPPPPHLIQPIVLLRTCDGRCNNGLLLFVRLVVRSNVNQPAKLIVIKCYCIIILRTSARWKGVPEGQL